jgi:hypothetical protein
VTNAKMTGEKRTVKEVEGRSWDRSVGIIMGYGLDGRSSIPGRDNRFLSTAVSRPTLGITQPHIQWVSGALLLGVMRPDREADHSPPSSSEVQNDGAVPPLPHTSSWHGTLSLKHKNNFTFA